MTLDLSTLTLTPEPFKFLISNPSSTATLVPNSTFQGNNATLTMTGEVGWNSTTSSNTIWLTINTNQQMGSSDYVKVSYGNTTVLTQNFSSSGTISITFLTTFTAAAIADGTLEFGIYDSNDEPYCVQYMDISALTLAPDPTPRMNVTSANQAITITPATFNVSKTATGQVPYTTIYGYNYLPLGFAYTGTWDQNYYRIDIDDDAGNHVYMNFYTGSTNLPSVIDVTNITSSHVGTGKYLDVKIYGGETSWPDTLINSIRIDTSALTLAPDPTPTPEKMNVYTDSANSIIITPNTYAAQKSATGQVGYNIISRANKGWLNLAYITPQTTSYHFFKVTGYDSSNNVIGESTAREDRKPGAIEITFGQSTVGTGEYITLILYGGLNSSDITNVIDTITVDTSALTLEAAPQGVYIYATNGPTISPKTNYPNNNGTITGEVSWDEMASSNHLDMWVFSTNTNLDITIVDANGTTLDTITYDTNNKLYIELDDTMIQDGYIEIGVRNHWDGQGTEPAYTYATLDISQLTLEPQPVGPNYEIYGSAMTLDPTDEFLQSYVSGNTYTAGDIILEAILDSTTAGTQADPWQAEFTSLEAPDLSSEYCGGFMAIGNPTGYAVSGDITIAPNINTGAVSLWCTTDTTTGPKYGQIALGFLNADLKYVDVSITPYTEPEPEPDPEEEEPEEEPGE